MTDISLRYLLFGEDRSASHAVQAVAATGQKTAGVLSKSFSGIGNAIGGEVGQITTEISDGLDQLSEHATSMGEKLTIAGTAVTGLGVGLSEFGKKDQQAEEQLKTAVDATGHSFDQYQNKFGSVVKQMQNFDHSTADTQTALRELVQATGSPAKAISHMGVVADLAAAKHEDLTTAATEVTKILGGSGSRTLLAFGIHMDTTGNKTKHAHEALDQLAQKLDGQAQASVNNFGSKIDIVKTKIEDWAAKMSGKIGPALTAIGPVLAIVGTATQILAARQAAAAVATEAETGATITQTVVQKAATVASKAWAAATWAVNAAMDANPIALVIIAIAALVAGVIIAWKHFQTFRDVVHSTLNAIQTAVGAVVSWIHDHWKLLVDILTGPFGALVIWIASHWDRVTAAVGATISWIRDHWQLLASILTGPFGAAVIYVVTHFDKIVGFVSNMPGRIARAAGGMWDSLRTGFIGTLNGIIDAWNGLSFHIEGPSVFGHHLGSVTINTPDLPHLAAGGIITRPTMVLAGEAGPEAIIPLPRRGGLGGDAGGITNQITINTGPMTTEGARELDRVLRKLNADTGGALGYA